MSGAWPDAGQRPKPCDEKTQRAVMLKHEGAAGAEQRDDRSDNK